MAQSLAPSDPELGLAVTRAWNDWFFDEWYSAYPERIVPSGICWLADPAVGAEEIRRNAARGFTAVTLPERPQYVGYRRCSPGIGTPSLRPASRPTP